MKCDAPEIVAVINAPRAEFGRWIGDEHVEPAFAAVAGRHDLIALGRRAISGVSVEDPVAHAVTVEVRYRDQALFHVGLAALDDAGRGKGGLLRPDGGGRFVLPHRSRRPKVDQGAVFVGLLHEGLGRRVPCVMQAAGIAAGSAAIDAVDVDVQFAAARQGIAEMLAVDLQPPGLVAGVEDPDAQGAAAGAAIGRGLRLHEVCDPVLLAVAVHVDVPVEAFSRFEGCVESVFGQKRAGALDDRRGRFGGVRGCGEGQGADKGGDDVSHRKRAPELDGAEPIRRFWQTPLSHARRRARTGCQRCLKAPRLRGLTISVRRFASRMCRRKERREKPPFRQWRFPAPERRRSFSFLPRNTC